MFSEAYKCITAKNFKEMHKKGRANNNWPFLGIIGKKKENLNIHFLLIIDYLFIPKIIDQTLMFE